MSADANDGIIESFVYLEKIPSLSTFIFMKLYIICILRNKNLSPAKHLSKLR